MHLCLHLSIEKHLEYLIAQSETPSDEKGCIRFHHQTTSLSEQYELIFVLILGRSQTYDIRLDLLIKYCKVYT